MRSKLPKLYEATYQDNKHFSFGKNWYRYLAKINSERITGAERSLTDFLGIGSTLKHHSFIDIGCGSGLFSLAAHRLGARPVVSVDVDKYSIASVTKLWETEGRPNDWKIYPGSVLDDEFIKSLGTFDIVYSWGVLHHTGNMWQAIKKAMTLVAPHGLIYLAIYNNKRGFQGSDFWLKIKRLYNHTSWGGKRLIEFLYLIELCFIAVGKIFTRGPKFVAAYQSPRGMNVYHDMIDWLGGYPYEFSRPEPIVDLFKKSDFRLVKLNDVGNNIGCNEYLFTREH